MYPANFDYKRPATVDEAVALLAQHGDAAKLLAGGHSLIPAMKLRLAQPKVVVDIGRISTLSYIREAGGKLAIGAMTTHQEIAASRLLQDKCPLLPETASHIGDVQVRNKGTIGGSLAHADPAADYPATILALDAEIEVAGPNGRRTIRAGDFFVDLLQTAIAANELITEIRVPVTAKTVAYVKTEQKASGFALAGVAAVISPSGVRVGVTGIAAKAYRATGVEQALKGQMTANAIALAATHAADGVEPLSDIHASAEYRAHLAQVNTRRALERAVSRG
ncbi:MAG: carbon monoxide dehydrogenase [Acidobacteria bacterium 13_1_40CM_65_14]|nr:MAG: carbon monoxide dehydrogenase [Acidobacteria bacterium 13_1_40CM_65_14]OLC79150.1 MAG: carbon monoxide dehydrogenase [Acidobacteria bacterium 13_1_40CM_4_65_8]